jgi:hypothetical protein
VVALRNGVYCFAVSPTLQVLHAQLVQSEHEIWIETQAVFSSSIAFSRIAQLCGLEGRAIASAAAFGADDKARHLHTAALLPGTGLGLKLIITLNVRGMFERASAPLVVRLEATPSISTDSSLFRISVPASTVMV